MSLISWVLTIGPRQLATPLGARFARAAGWAIAGSVLARLFNFAAFAIAARMLGREQFGGLSIIQTTVLMFSLVGTAGFGVTAARYVGQLRSSDPGRAGRILGLSALTTLLFGGALCMALAVLSPLLASRSLGKPGLATPLLISSGLVLFGAFNGYQVGALSGFEAFERTARINVWSGLVSLPAITLGCWLYGLNGAIAGLTASIAFACLANQFALRHACKQNGVAVSYRKCWMEAAVAWRFAFPALLGAAIVAPANWLVGALLARQPNGLLELGLYGAADRWRVLIMFIPTCIFSTVVPILSNLEATGDHHAMNKLFRANVWLSAALTMLPALLVLLCAKPMMAVFGRGYRTGAAVLCLLALSAIPQALNTILGQRIALKSMWVRLCFDCVLVLVLVVTAYSCIPRFGALGLAAANAVAFACAAAGLALYIRRLPSSDKFAEC